MTDPTLDQFLRACGATGPLRLGLEGPDAPGIESRGLTQPFLVIGREAGVDLRLDHPDVSRRHAYLQLLDGRLFCMDLQSRTGTRWPDGPRPMGWIHPGQAIGIGPYWLWFHGDQTDPAPADEELPPRLGPAVEASLEIAGPGPTPQTTWRLRRALVLLGRARPSWVRLPSREVSRIHCSLVRTGAGFWVVDLLGRGGITVQGRPARWARLDPDTELGLGPYRVRLRTRLEPDGPGWPLALAGTPAADRWVPARTPAAAAPARPLLATRVEPADASLVPLVQEIGLMQQQMADQFQQALMMMFELFSSMHQDEMRLIREELAEIRRLSEEQQRLQAELIGRPAGAESAATAPARPAATAAVTGSSSAEMVVVPPPTRPAPTPAAAGGAAPGPAEGVAAAAPGARIGREDLHALLSQRLAAIQQERQSRWQHLVQSLLGRNPTRATP